MNIKFENVVKKYDQNVVLNKINLDIDKSGIVILGPSGAGKSTLLRCINMLDSHDSGNLYIGNKSIKDYDLSELRTKIGFVFQNFCLFNNMNVVENLIYSPIKLGIVKKSDAIEKAINLLKGFNIESKKDLMHKDLSGGQKQKVAICRSLMMDPEVILFDEPTSALDVESVKDLIEIIKELRDKITIITVTHHVEFAKAIAKRIIFIDHGLVLDDQSSEDFFTNTKSQRAKIFLRNTIYS